MIPVKSPKQSENNNKITWFVFTHRSEIRRAAAAAERENLVRPCSETTRVPEENVLGISKSQKKMFFEFSIFNEGSRLLGPFEMTEK